MTKAELVKQIDDLETTFMETKDPYARLSILKFGLDPLYKDLGQLVYEEEKSK